MFKIGMGALAVFGGFILEVNNNKKG